MWLLGNKTAEEDVAEAHVRQKEGFNFFKLKIGVKPLAKEIAIAFAVREALPKTPLCADANCGLTLADARKYVEQTRKARLMFVEQPLAYDDFDGLKKLPRAQQGADRRRRRHPFVRRHRVERKAGAGGVSLKLIKLGGIIARGRSRQALPEARPVGEHRRENRRVRASPAPRRCISPARCRRPTGASALPISIWPRTS